MPLIINMALYGIINLALMHQHCHLNEIGDPNIVILYDNDYNKFK